MTTSTPIEPPTPLSLEDLETVPGVLGDIARERFRAYEGVLIEGGLKSALQKPRERPRFKDALKQGGVSIIAEIKRSSPSQGAIAELNPVEAARAYRRGGASALSVLTEPNHFGGALKHLSEVADAVELPLLRKDFTLHPAQISEAKRAGASAVLLIVAVLAEHTKAYLQYAHSLGLDALVEVHDERELQTALDAGADIIGVNNRDLRTLEINLENAPKLIKLAKEQGFNSVLVAESGYRSAAELKELKGVADAVLIGTSIAGSGDLEEAVRALREEL